jgi:hypothetical protein
MVARGKDRKMSKMARDPDRKNPKGFCKSQGLKAVVLGGMIFATGALGRILPSSSAKPNDGGGSFLEVFRRGVNPRDITNQNEETTIGISPYTARRQLEDPELKALEVSAHSSYEELWMKIDYFRRETTTGRYYESNDTDDVKRMKMQALEVIPMIVEKYLAGKGEYTNINNESVTEKQKREYEAMVVKAIMAEIEIARDTFETKKKDAAKAAAAAALAERTAAAQAARAPNTNTAIGANQENWNNEANSDRTDSVVSDEDENSGESYLQLGVRVVTVRGKAEEAARREAAKKKEQEAAMQEKPDVTAENRNTWEVRDVIN